MFYLSENGNKHQRNPLLFYVIIPYLNDHFSVADLWPCLCHLYIFASFVMWALRKDFFLEKKPYQCWPRPWMRPPACSRPGCGPVQWGPLPSHPPAQSRAFYQRLRIYLFHLIHFFLNRQFQRLNLIFSYFRRQKKEPFLNHFNESICNEE